MANQITRLYGLIGTPLVHSFSESYFNKKFESEGINARYINFELPDIGDLMEVLSEYPDLCGLNVTLPYKELVIPYMDEMDATALEIGAVNVIQITRTKKGDISLKGYNSDCPAFADTIKPLLTPFRKKALILGTGGAAKAVRAALTSLGIKSTFVSRTPREDMLTYSELTPEIMAEYKIIVNTTPLGMVPGIEKYPDIPYDYLTPEHLCYDLIYNPDVTLFLKKSASKGAEIKNGLEMLLLQAFESWNIWNRTNHN